MTLNKTTLFEDVLYFFRLALPGLDLDIDGDPQVLLFAIKLLSLGQDF